MARIAPAAARGYPHPGTQRGNRGRRTFFGAAGCRAPLGRPVKVHRGSRAAERQYDGQNRRITKTVGETATHFFFNESWQALEERSFVTNDKEQMTNDPSVQYLWDIRYIDAAVVRFHDAGTNGSYADAGDNILYYTQDANFNTTALVDEATGDVVERYIYTPYGEATVLEDDWTADGDNASDVANTRLFQGQEFNPETGLDSSRVRPAYHPTMGQWLSRDVKVYADTYNLYQYCASAPVQFLDPLGTSLIVGDLRAPQGYQPPALGNTPTLMPGEVLSPELPAVPEAPPQQSMSQGSVMPEVMRRDEEPVAGTNGGYSWYSYWYLDRPSRKGGFVSGKVSVTLNVWDCDGKPYDLFKLGLKERYSHYTEVWDVTAGSSRLYPDDGMDIFMAKAFPECTKGELIQESRVAFHEGFDYSREVFTAKAGSPAGKLRFTTGQPDFPGGYADRLRIIKVSWKIWGHSTDFSLTDLRR